jgi:flagellar basal-body rod modification protein FlgD
MDGINSTTNKNAFSDGLTKPKATDKAEENSFVDGLKKTNVKENVKSDQTDFMKLMIAQLKNQNPLDPKDGAEFLSQLAQFTQVEGITKLNDQFTGLSSRLRSSQALQATALVGRKVRVESDKAIYTSDATVSGSADLPMSSTNINMTVTDRTGKLVTQMNLPTSVAGPIPISWNGKDLNGNPVPEGEYTISVKAEQSGKMEALKTEMDANVNSVTIGTDGAMTLNIAAVGAVPIEKVTQIK